MATKSPTWLTLTDRAIRTKDGSTIDIVEAMARSNPILQIMPFLQANQATHHIFNKRDALPSIDWLSVGEGKSFAKSSITPHQETIGFAGKLSRVPDDLVKLCANGAEAQELRRTEDLAFVEACAQEMADTIFYGDNSTEPKSITGFGPRRATLNATDNLGNINVIGNGGTSSALTSIYIVEFGPTMFHGVIPPNFPAGISVTDKGKLWMQDPDNSAKYLDYWVTEFGFAMGIVEKNDRALRRIANIKTTGTSNLVNPDKIIEAVNDLPSHGRNAFIFCNSDVMTQIEIKNKDYVKETDMFGMPVPAFRGQVPFVVCDAISSSETQVS